MDSVETYASRAVFVHPRDGKILWVSMDFVLQEHGVPHDGPKDSNTGGYTRDILDRNETRRRKPRDARKHTALQRETPSFTQVQGPRGEVKPLLPAFLYYDAIPREEYKVLVTEP
jgi:hypothetical protein